MSSPRVNARYHSACGPDGGLADQTIAPAKRLTCQRAVERKRFHLRRFALLGDAPTGLRSERSLHRAASDRDGDLRAPAEGPKLSARGTPVSVASAPGVDEVAGKAIEYVLPRPRREGWRSTSSWPPTIARIDVGHDLILGEIAAARSRCRRARSRPQCRRLEIGSRKRGGDELGGGLRGGVGLVPAKRIAFAERSPHCGFRRPCRLSRRERRAVRRSSRKASSRFAVPITLVAKVAIGSRTARVTSACAAK